MRVAQGTKLGTGEPAPLPGIYVVVVQGEVATVCQMDEATKVVIQSILDGSGLSSRSTSIVGPVGITTDRIAIEAEVEAVLDSWLP